MATKASLVTALVIDVGTDSVRGTIAEVGDKRFRELEDIHRPVDLTSAFRGGHLDRKTITDLEQAFADLIDAGKAYGVSRIRAVGTSALREAANADLVIDGLRRRTGVELEAIDAAEEARLYFEALRWTQTQTGLRLPGRSLLMDIGAGTSVLAVIAAGKLIHAVDDHFGTVRLSEEFADLRDTHDYANAIDRFAHGAVEMQLSRLPTGRLRHLVVTGSEVRLLLEILRPSATGLVEALPARLLHGWYEAVAPQTPRLRAELSGCDRATATRLLPVAAMLRHLCLQCGIDELVVPRLNLRDGMVADQMGGARGPHRFGRQQLLAAAKQLSARYGMDRAYAQNTASLAAQLFDQTIDLHQLGNRERTLLEFAALVHDVGAFINVRSRHKHSFHIISSTDIAGLSQREKAIVAHVARYHRRASPTSSHDEYMVLDRYDRVVIRVLSSLLRLAYALDVERTQRIRQIRCEVVDARLLLHVDRREVALERWSLAGKAPLFQEVFGLEVVLLPREED